MKKFLISLLLGVSMVTMAGCGNANKEVANTNVEQNEREGAYPNFQDKETEEPIELSKEDREEELVNNLNEYFYDVNSELNSADELNASANTICYFSGNTLYVYDFVDWSNSTLNVTNERMVEHIIDNANGEAMYTMIDTGKIILEVTESMFKSVGLNSDDYNIVYSNCVGKPDDEYFYVIFRLNGKGEIIELFGESVN